MGLGDLYDSEEEDVDTSDSSGNSHNDESSDEDEESSNDSGTTDNDTEDSDFETEKTPTARSVKGKGAARELVTPQRMKRKVLRTDSDDENDDENAPHPKADGRDYNVTFLEKALNLKWSRTPVVPSYDKWQFTGPAPGYLD
jgi:hypothetical protein